MFGQLQSSGPGPLQVHLVTPIKVILAATDFTPRSRAVAGRAAALARLHKARLVIVTAIEARPRTVKRLRIGKLVDQTAHAHEAFRRLRESLSDIDLHFEIAHGPPWQSIPQLARQFDADLIVLGLHKPRRMLETMRMTTLERITQGAECPVLIAHDPEIRPYRKVLGAVTFAPASARALQVASDLAPGANFQAIHALRLPLGATMPARDLMKSAEMTEAEMLRQSFMAIKGLPENLALPEIVAGGVHEVLQFRISEYQPDLVVIGSHSGRDPKTLGNYARDLMRAPPCDMLVGKPS